MRKARKWMALLLTLCMVVPNISGAVSKDLSTVQAAEAGQISEGTEMLASGETLLKAGSIPASEDTITEGQPFAKGTAGSNIFRIPCLITLDNEYLVAAADTRYTEYRDFGGIDTIAAVSKDNGATWNYSFPIYFPDSQGSAGWEQATTAIDPALVQGPDGTIYCFADMNPTGITTFDIWPGPGTGFVTIDGVERLALTGTYTKPVENVSYGNPDDYEYYVGDFNEEGFAPVLNKADHTPTEWGVDEWYNIYTVNEETGEYEATLTQTQVNSSTRIQQNAFYAGSVLHVYSTGYIWMVKSYDNGMTWEDPEILNTQIKRDDGKETALLVSPGQGMVTSEGDIIVGCYDTYGVENASIFYSTDNGKSWKRSNDVNVTSSENEIVELPDGTLRMFYRSNTMKVCYADIVKNADDTYTIGAGKELPIGVSSNCNVSAIMLEDTKIDDKPVVIISFPEGPGSWNRVKGRIFAFTINEDNSMNHVNTYAINEDAFAYSCMTELDNGNVGILWEPGINEASAIRYDEIEIGKVIGKEKDINLFLGDIYTETEVVEKAKEITTAPDAKVAELELATETLATVSLHDHVARVDSNMSSFSAAVNDQISLDEAEFTFTEVNGGYHIYNEEKEVYLTNSTSATSFFAAAAAAMKVTAVQGDEGTEFRICKADSTRYIMFWFPQMNFNGNSGGYSSTMTQGSQELVLLEKQNVVSGTDLIPGYARADAVTSGSKYLIAYIWSDGSVIVLYPQNGTDAQTKLVGEAAEITKTTMTITATGIGTTTAVVDDKIYHINVADPSDNPFYAGMDLPTDGMKLTAGSLEPSEGSLEALFDGNPDTFYHSNWSGTRPTTADFWITIELPEVTEISGMRYLPRQSSVNGRILSYEISYSLDGETWTEAVSGDWADDYNWKLAKFGENVEAKFVKIFAVDSKADVTGRHLTGAELRVLKAVEKPEVPDVPVIPDTEVCNIFTDVAHGAWYEGAIQYVYDEGIMFGDNGAFSPDADTSRAMVAMILYRLEGEPKVTDYTKYNQFTDVAADAWYADAVAWALNEGLATGDSYNMLYNPNVSVTREQLATFLYRYAEYTGADVTVKGTQAEIFGGVYVSEWAREGFAWAIENGIIKGAEVADGAGNISYDLAPQGTASRAQFATVLQRHIGGAAK